MSSYSRPSLHFPEADRTFLSSHLPPSSSPSSPSSSSPKNALYPFTTLTFATSLDSALALSPTIPTPLSGPETKALTHYLRSHHDAILIGCGTAIADNPALNCRLAGVGGGYGGDALTGQPRPIVIDPHLRWDFENETCKAMELARSGRGWAPWIITSATSASEEVILRKRREMEGFGGKVLVVEGKSEDGRMDWREILRVLREQGVKSVMIEGGATVINSLLQERYFDLVDEVIVTIAPVWLGQGGVVVSPLRGDEGRAAVRLKDVSWRQFGQDVVMCGKINTST